MIVRRALLRCVVVAWLLAAAAPATAVSFGLRGSADEYKWPVGLAGLEGGGAALIVANGNIVAFTPTGDIDWARGFASAEAVEGWLLAGTPDGGVAAVLRLPDWPGTRSAIVKLDARGNEMWTTTVDGGNSNGSLIAMPDGSLLLSRGAGSTGVLRVEPDGRPAWNVSFTGQSASTSSHLARFGDGSALVARDDGSVLHLARVLADGRVSWLEKVDVSVSAFGFSVVTLPNGNALVQVATTFIEIAADGRIVRQARQDMPLDMLVVNAGGTLAGRLYPSAALARVGADLRVVDGWDFDAPPPMWLARWSDGWIAANGLDWDGDLGPSPRSTLVTLLDAQVRLAGGCSESAPHAVSSSASNVSLSPSWLPASPRRVSVSTDVVTVTVLPIPTADFACAPSGCVADALEPDSCAHSEAQLAQGPLSLNFCDDAEDIVAIHACDGARHVVTTSALGMNADTVLELWDEGCTTLLASDDDGGGGLASRMEFVATGDVTYRVIVRQKDGTSGPAREYVLSMERPDCGDPAWAVDLWVSGVEMDVTAHAAAMDEQVVLGVAGSDIVAARLHADSSPAWASRLTAPGMTLVGRDIVALASGGALVAGTVTPPSARSKGFVAKLTATGLLEREWILEEPNVSITPSNLTSRPGGWLASVHASLDACLVSGNDDGTMAWRSCLDHSSQTDRSVDTGDGGAVAFTDRGTPRPSLWRVRPDGSIDWQFQLTRRDNEALRILDVRPEATGFALLAESQVSPTELWLYHLDSAGLVTDRGSRAISPPLPLATGIVDGRIDADGSITTSVWIQDRVGPLGSRQGIVRFSPALEPMSDHVGLPYGGTMELGDGFIAVGNFPTEYADLWRLRSSGSPAASCLPTKWLSESVVGPDPPDLAAIALAVATHSIALGAPALAVDLVTLDVRTACSSLPCPPSTTSITSVDAPSPCEGAVTTLTADGTGVGALTHEWDLDWDGVSFDVDAVGQRVQSIFPAGTRSVAVRLRDACPWRVAPAIATTSFDVLSAASPTILGPAFGCAGSPCTTLSIPGTWASVTWSHGSTGATTCVSSASQRTYTATVVDASGCTYIVSHELRVAAQQIAVTLQETCDSAGRMLEAVVSGGVPPFTFAWSSGETEGSIPVDGTPRTITVTDAAGCTATLDWIPPPECGPPGEVSGPGDSPLTATGKTDTIIRVAPEPGARDYNLLVGAIGTYHSPDPGKAACHETTWTDAGGLLESTTRLDSDTWFVVTASNAAGEGPAGRGTDGERAARPGWNGCGSSP